MRRVAYLLVMFCASGCALNPYYVEDPTTLLGVGPKPSSIVKALRCEVMTFLLANRLRADKRKEFDVKIDKQKLKDPAALEAEIGVLKKLRYIDLAENQLAAVYLDFKNTNSFSTTFSDSRRVPIVGGSETFQWGTGYTDTRAYQLGQPFAVHQGGDLGPEKGAQGAWQPGDNRDAVKFSSIYYRQQSADADFYCYKSLAESNTRTLKDAINEIQVLVEHGLGAAAYENFTRVSVGPGGKTLAKWFQEVGEDMAISSSTIGATTEKAILGQLSFIFTLTAKPAADTKYTLIANLINPRIPAVTMSAEHIGTFSIFLNSPNALLVLGAKGGNTTWPRRPPQDGDDVVVLKQIRQETQASIEQNNKLLTEIRDLLKQ